MILKNVTVSCHWKHISRVQRVISRHSTTPLICFRPQALYKCLDARHTVYSWGCLQLLNLWGKWDDDIRHYRIVYFGVSPDEITIADVFVAQCCTQLLWSLIPLGLIFLGLIGLSRISLVPSSIDSKFDRHQSECICKRLLRTEGAAMSHSVAASMPQRIAPKMALQKAKLQNVTFSYTK